MEYLADHPPAHIILAGVHMKQKSARVRKQPANSPMDDLRREVMLAGGVVHGPLPAIYRDK